jgi:hypothetical protein
MPPALLSLDELVELASSYQQHSVLVKASEEIGCAAKELSNISHTHVESSFEMTNHRLSYELCMRLSWSSLGRTALNKVDAWRCSLFGISASLIALEDNEDMEEEEWASSMVELHPFIQLCVDLLSCPTSRIVGSLLLGDTPDCDVITRVITRSYQRLRCWVLTDLNLSRLGSSIEAKLLSGLFFLGARLSADKIAPGLKGLELLQKYLNCSEKDFLCGIFETRTAHFRPASVPAITPEDMIGYIFDSFLPGCCHVPRLTQDCSSILDGLCNAREELGLPLLVAGDDLNISMTEGSVSAGTTTHCLTEGVASKGCVGAQVLTQDIKAMYTCGGTVVIRGLGSRISPDKHSPFTPALKLQRSLSQYFGLSTSSNLYVTPPGRQGLNCHADDHDVFVAQLSGSKLWMIKDLPEGSSLPLSYHHLPLPPPLDKSDPGVLKVILRPGEILYLPRGAAHQAVSLEEASIHVSISLEVDKDKSWGGLMHVALRSGCSDEEQWARVKEWLESRIKEHRIHSRACPLLAADRPQRILLQSLLPLSSYGDGVEAHDLSLFLAAWKALWCPLISAKIEDGLSKKDFDVISRCLHHDVALAAREEWRSIIGGRTLASVGFESAISSLQLDKTQLK